MKEITTRKEDWTRRYPENRLGGKMIDRFEKKHKITLISIKN
jgi:hypothetical protein